jgi:serine/threonine protein kinase
LHKGELSPAADVYALGILLYELLCGTLPGRRSPMPSASARVKEKLGDQVKALDDLFDKMTQDSLTERFKNFDEVLTALYALLPKKNVVGRGTLLLYEKDWAESPAGADNPFGQMPGTGLESLPSAEGESIDASGEDTASGVTKHTAVTSEAQ